MRVLLFIITIFYYNFAYSGIIDSLVDLSSNKDLIEEDYNLDLEDQPSLFFSDQELLSIQEKIKLFIIEQQDDKEVSSAQLLEEKLYLNAIIYVNGHNDNAWINNKRYYLGKSKNNIKLLKINKHKVRVEYSLTSLNINHYIKQWNKIFTNKINSYTYVSYNKVFKLDLNNKKLYFDMLINGSVDLGSLKIYDGDIRNQ